MKSFRAPLAAFALALSLTAAAPAALADDPIVLEARHGLSVLALTAAPGGGFALVAQELMPYAGGTDPRVHVYRYEANGRERWHKIIDRKGPQIARAITYGPGEILYVGGLDGSDLTASSYQGMLAAFDPAGNVIMDSVFGDPAPVEDFVTGFALTANAEIIAAGRVKVNVERDADMRVFELDADGREVWSTVVKGAAQESYPLVVTGTGGTFVGGTYENRRVFIQRVDVAGRAVRSFASFTMPRRAAIAQMTGSPDGGVIVAINLSGGNNESRLVRVGANGEVVWDVKVPGNTVIADITRLPNGLIGVAGTSDDSKTLETRAWLKAYNESGREVGEIRPDYDGQTRAGGVTIDRQGGVYFAYSPVDESIPAKPDPIIVEQIRVD